MHCPVHLGAAALLVVLCSDTCCTCPTPLLPAVVAHAARPCGLSATCVACTAISPWACWLRHVKPVSPPIVQLCMRLCVAKSGNNDLLKLTKAC